VAEVNMLARNIAEANGKIATLSGLGQPANDLFDERDRQGSTRSWVTSPGRTILLDERDCAAGPALGGGSIVGLMRFQNDHLIDGRNLVGQLAASVAGAANTQQMLGMNLYTPFGSVPVEPFFRLGETRTVAHAANARNGSGQLVGDLRITRTPGESSRLVATDYSLRVETDGSWSIARLPDPDPGDWQPLAPGQTIDGFSVDAVPGFDPVPGDRFVLQPVSRAGRGMSVMLDDVRDIAAASPLVATAFPTPTGTVSIDNLRMLQAPTNPTVGVSIRFVDDAGNYEWAWTDDPAVVVGTGLWQPGQPIPPDPATMNGFSLTLRGVPRTGDVLLIEPASAQNFAQNNGNALSLSLLRDERITGGLTATDAYAAAMADVGVRVQGARSTSTISAAMADQAERARSNESGVNLDEEAARLIQFQQSYQAAAKVLQIAQSVFETLLSTAGI
jgi:flagellar hook-associated protein 1